MYFDTAGVEHTAESARIAIQEAKKQGITHVVAASNTGETILALVKEAKEQEYEVQLVCVSHVFGFKENGKNELSGESRRDMEEQGIKVCTAAHALSGCERSLSRKFQGIYPAEIIAHTLRMFGQGTKVCVEVAAMALDAGHVPYGEKLIALGGTGRGADTAIVLSPAYSASILETRIHEILCKPR